MMATQRGYLLPGDIAPEFQVIIVEKSSKGPFCGIPTCFILFNDLGHGRRPEGQRRHRGEPEVVRLQGEVRGALLLPSRLHVRLPHGDHRL